MQMIFKGIFIARFQQGEIHAVCSRDSNKTGPSYMHIFYRNHHFVKGAQFFNHKSMWQASLVNDVYHSFIFLVEPDGSIIFSVDLHVLSVAGINQETMLEQFL